MAYQLLSTARDCMWLVDTHLRDVEIPLKWKMFGSFAIYGNEDAPTHLKLYMSDNPRIGDSFLSIIFSGDELLVREVPSTAIDR